MSASAGWGTALRPAQRNVIFSLDALRLDSKPAVPMAQLYVELVALRFRVVVTAMVPAVERPGIFDWFVREGLPQPTRLFLRDDFTPSQPSSGAALAKLVTERLGRGIWLAFDSDADACAAYAGHGLTALFVARASGKKLKKG